MDSHGPDNLDRLIAYVEGVMPDGERAGFERELAASAGLRAELERMRRIDRALASSLAPPADFRVDVRPAAPTVADARAAASWRRWAGIAGSAIAASVLLALAWLYTAGPTSRQQPLTVSSLYHGQLAGGFVPDWVCKDDREFIDTTQRAFGVPLLARTEGDVEIVGWSGYGDRLADLGLGPAAKEVLARVGGTEVIVLIDKPAPARPPATDSVALNVFERRIGDVALYEITPLDKPAAIEQFKLQQP